MNESFSPGVVAQATKLQAVYSTDVMERSDGITGVWYHNFIIAI